jgi:endo-1,4-beta-xylanase
MHVTLGALAALAVATLTPLSAADGLNTRAAAASSRFFGTAVSTTVLADAGAGAIAANAADFGQWTCENEMKPDTTEPSQGVFKFDAADAIMARAEEAGATMRCHTLVWHSQVPAWMESGGFDNQTLIEVMEAHIAGVVGHFKGEAGRGVPLGGSVFFASATRAGPASQSAIQMLTRPIH